MGGGAHTHVLKTFRFAWRHRAEWRPAVRWLASVEEARPLASMGLDARTAVGRGVVALEPTAILGREVEAALRPEFGHRRWAALFPARFARVLGHSVLTEARSLEIVASLRALLMPVAVHGIEFPCKAWATSARMGRSRAPAFWAVFRGMTCDNASSVPCCCARRPRRAVARFRFLASQRRAQSPSGDI